MLLFTFVQPHSYISKIIYLLLGCIILAFGVYLEVLANVVMLPGESFVRAVVDTWHRDFGTTKVMFDVTMAVVAIALSLLLSMTRQKTRYTKPREKSLPELRSSQLSGNIRYGFWISEGN